MREEGEYERYLCGHWVLQTSAPDEEVQITNQFVASMTVDRREWLVGFEMDPTAEEIGTRLLGRCDYCLQTD